MAGWDAEWYSRGDDRKLGKQGCTHQPCMQGHSVSKVLAGIVTVTDPWQQLLCGYGHTLHDCGHVNVAHAKHNAELWHFMHRHSPSTSARTAELAL